MSTLDDLVFINNLPKLDLHGFDRFCAQVAINDFIRDNVKLKNEFVVIVHGIGSGVLRKQVGITLKQSKQVVAYKTYYFNQGCTIIQIKV